MSVPVKTPVMEKRLIRQVPQTIGTLTDRGGRTVPVQFSLAQWRFYMGGVPAMRRADGELQFFNLADAFDMRDVDQGVTLEGAGIRAEVAMVSLRAFTVIDGSVNDISLPHCGAVPSCPEMIHH